MDNSNRLSQKTTEHTNMQVYLQTDSNLQSSAIANMAIFSKGSKIDSEHCCNIWFKVQIVWRIVTLFSQSIDLQVLFPQS